MRLVLGKVLPDYEMAVRVVGASGAMVVSNDCCRCMVFPDGREDLIGMTALDSFELKFQGGF